MNSEFSCAHCATINRLTSYTLAQYVKAPMPQKCTRCGATHSCARGGVDGGSGSSDRPGPTNGQWADADWLGCRDGKWRPVEPGTFPLANGLPARVGRLRGYGNAIVPAQAAEFVTAYMEARGEVQAATWVDCVHRPVQHGFYECIFHDLDIPLKLYWDGSRFTWNNRSVITRTLVKWRGVTL